MNFTEGNAKLLLTSVVGVLGLGSLAFFLSGDNSGGSEDLLPALTLKETQDILSKILERVKIISVRYARASQQIQQQVAQQGQQMSELEVNKNFILPHFETGFQDAEDEVLAEFDCDADELEEAGRYYADKENDELVMELLTKLKRLHATFGGESDMNEFTGGNGAAAAAAAAPTGEKLTLQNVVDILRTLSEKVGNATDMYCENFIKSFGLPQSQALMEQFQGGMLQMSESMETQVLQAFGISAADFQAGIMEHQSNPSLHEVIQAMQVQNQQRLLKHGISMQ